MSKLNVELPETTRKGIFIWRVRDDGDKCGRKFLAVGEAESLEDAAAIAERVRKACEPIINKVKP